MDADILLSTQNLINTLKDNIFGIFTDSPVLSWIAMIAALLFALVYLRVLFCKLTGIDYSGGRW